MGSCAPVGGNGEVVVISLRKAVAENKTQDMGPVQSRCWMVNLIRCIMCGSQAGNGPQSRLGLEGQDVENVSMAE